MSQQLLGALEVGRSSWRMICRFDRASDELAAAVVTSDLLAEQ